jgi:hypothetical protein
VVAVGAGIGDDVHFHGRQTTVAPRAGLDAHAHGVARGRADELLLAGEFELDRLAGLEHRERDDVLDQHLLLGAEAAAHALAEHADLGGIETEKAGSARRVRNGVCVLERMLSRCASSNQPIAQCVSRCACCTRWVT